MSDPNYNLFDLLRILLKHKKNIILLSLIAVTLSVIIAFLLPVYYKSTAMFYPYNLRGFDPRNLDQPSELFGNKEDCDRILLIGTSSILEDTLIKKYDLYHRYDIDTTVKYARALLIEKLRDNVKIGKNDRDAIEITVYDKDPKVAADMANEIIKLIDKINKVPIIENYAKILNVFKAQADERYSELDSLYHNVGVFKKESQYRKADSYFDDIKNADIRITSFLLDALNTKEKYQRAVLYFNSGLTSIFIVEPAIVNEKKARPVRWIIVLSSTFVAFVLICMTVIVMEIYNNEPKIHENRS